MSAFQLASDELFYFPEPADPASTEWPGTPLGLSNTITRTKGRTARHNKCVDSTPGLLEKLLATVYRHLERRVGQEPIHTHDVVIHGVRVRATTNSPHLYDFWLDNWHSVQEWKEYGGRVSKDPQVKVYALVGVPNEPEAAYYSRQANTVIFFNTSYYGQLKSWVLGAVGRWLASEYGIHSIHGACVEMNGRGVLYIAPTGTGKSTSSYGLMDYPNTRFHSDDWVYLRYAYRTRSGEPVVVLEAEDSADERARGYQVHRWIERHAGAPHARLRVMSLGQDEFSLSLGELDLGHPPEAYAYTSEKFFYLRTNLVENFPPAICELASAKHENVPDVTAEFIARHAHVLDAMGPTLAHSDCPAFQGESESEIRRRAARLIAFDNARAMLDMSRVLPLARRFGNPLEPLRLVAVILLKRNPADPSVLNHVLLEPFMERLLIGETPEGKRETAYNAYRVVDDRAERQYVEMLERLAGPGRPLDALFDEARDAPESLREEFELFHVLYNAARTYDLNTTLERDSSVPDKQEAVRRTLAIIARVIKEEPPDIQLTLESYRDYIR